MPFELTDETIEEPKAKAATAAGDTGGFELPDEEVAPPQPKSVKPVYTPVGFVDPKALEQAKFVADRFINAAASSPGIVADALDAINQSGVQIPGAMGIGTILPAARKAQLAAIGYDPASGQPAPLGTENIKSALREYNVLPTPRAPGGWLERLLGNVADFAGASVAPVGSFAKALVPAATGGTLLTGAQEAGLGPFWQFLAGLAGGVGGGAAEARMAASGLPKPPKLTPAQAARVKTGEAVLNQGIEEVPTTDIGVPGFKATTAQALGDDAMLAQEQALAKAKGPEAKALAERQAANVAALRAETGRVAEDVSGAPTDIRTHATERLSEADQAVEAKLAELARRDSETTSREATGRLRTLRDQAHDVAQAPAVTGRFMNAQIDVGEIEQVLKERLKTMPAGRRDMPVLVQNILDDLIPKKEASAAEKILGEPVEIVRSQPETPPAAAAAETPAVTTAGPAESPLGKMIDTAKQERTQGAFERQFVEEPTAAPAQTTTAPLREIAPIRTTLREYAQAAARATDPATKRQAHIYEELGDALEDYFDKLEARMPGDDIAEWRQFQQGWKEYVNTYVKPNDTRKMFGATVSGEPRVAPETALSQYVKRGDAGGPAIQRLLNMMPEAEAQAYVQDWLLANGEGNAAKILHDYAAALRRVPVVQTRIQELADLQATAASLHESPLGVIAQSDPKKFIEAIVKHRYDPVGFGKRAMEEMRTPEAKRGLQRAFADWIVDQVADKQFSAERIQQLKRDYGPLIDLYLGPGGRQRLDRVEGGLRLIEQKPVTRAGAEEAPQYGVRPLDQAISRVQRNQGNLAAAQAGAEIGGALAGTPGRLTGGLIGWAVGGKIQTGYNAMQDEGRMLLRDFLLDPVTANEMIREAKAARASKMVRPGMKPWFDKLSGGAAVGAIGGIEAAEPPPPALEIPPLAPGLELQTPASPDSQSEDESKSWLQRN